MHVAPNSGPLALAGLARPANWCVRARPPSPTQGVTWPPRQRGALGWPAPVSRAPPRSPPGEQHLRRGLRRGSVTGWSQSCAESAVFELALPRASSCRQAGDRAEPSSTFPGPARSSCSRTLPTRQRDRPASSKEGVAAALWAAHKRVDEPGSAPMAREGGSRLHFAPGRRPGGAPFPRHGLRSVDLSQSVAVALSGYSKPLPGPCAGLLRAQGRPEA